MVLHTFYYSKHQLLPQLELLLKADVWHAAAINRSCTVVVQ